MRSVTAVQRIYRRVCPNIHCIWDLTTAMRRTMLTMAMTMAKRDHVENEEHGDDKKFLQLTYLLGEVCVRSSPCRFDLTQGGP